MDYFSSAFGGFRPNIDLDAAVKFSLNAILMDARLIDLASLLTDGHEIGGVEGVPGWIIERRDSGAAGEMPGYSSWPVWASFRAYVDPHEFELAHPEYFMDKTGFHKYALAALEAFLRVNPEQNAAASAALALARAE